MTVTACAIESESSSMRLRGRDDHPTARFSKALLVRLIKHVDGDLFDDGARDRPIQSKATGEAVEAPHQVLDRGSVEGLSHPCTGCDSRTTVRTMLRL